MNKLIILLGFIILPIAICAQNNFKPGFIITNENDTVYGWIDYRTDKINAESCLFKEKENGESKTYYPRYLKGYRFTEQGKFYMSKEIKFNTSTRRVFLEFMLQGMINLYRYDFGDDVCYYFEKEDGELVPVGKRRGTFIDEEDITAVYHRNDNRYKNILGYVFQDTEQVAERAKTARFNNKSMMYLAKLYHDEVCTTGEECIVFEEKPDRNYTKFKFSVYGGLRFNKYIFDENRTLLPAMENNFGMSPTIGVQLNVSVPRRIKPLSLQVDLSLSSLNKTAEYKEVHTKYPYKYKYESTMMAAKIGGKYTFQTRQWQPTIEGNFVYLNTFNRKMSMGDKEALSNTSAYDASQAPFDYVFGMEFGVGLDYLLEKENAIFCRLSYEYYPNNRFIDVDYFHGKKLLKDRLHAIVLKAGYTF